MYDPCLGKAISRRRITKDGEPASVAAGTWFAERVDPDIAAIGEAVRARVPDICF
jgi:hypothetical protein